MSDTFLFLALTVLASLFVLVLIFCRKKIKKLEHAVYHDFVTDLTNWNWMWTKIGYSSDEGEIPFDFVHFDIKDFKAFNELYDHDVGNAVLKFVGQLLEQQKDFILYSAKCHNDNFAFITRPDFNGNLKERLIKLFDDIKYFPGYEDMPLYFRVGVTVKSTKMRRQDTVADTAKMAQALGKKVNCTEIIFYDDSMKDLLLKGDYLKRALPDAIKRGEILVYYQPKINPKNDKVMAAEALVRWNFDGEKIMAPGDFIPHLEKNNAIAILDRAVLEVVCKDLERWKAEGKKLVPISINLSQKEIYQARLVEEITQLVDKYNVDHKLIEFEVTESAFFEDKEYMLNVLNNLKQNGFVLSMDDFGTGYSSFNLLKDIPLDVLKIDKSFIDSIGHGDEKSKGPKIVQGIISMVKHMNLLNVAEGVEHEAQKEVLKNWGCDMIQGYYYSKPLPCKEFEEKYL